MKTPQRVFIAKLHNLAVFDPIGDPVGKVRDAVCIPRAGKNPRVVGMVVEVPGKREVFMPMTRVTSLDAGQVITTGLVNMRRFEKRPSETLMVAEMLDREVTITADRSVATVEDLQIRHVRPGDWELTKVFVRQGPARRGLTARFRRTGETHLLPLADVDGLLPVVGRHDTAAQLIASLDGMKPADIADRIKDLPPQRQRQLAADLSDDQLADIIEELGEDDQMAMLSGMREDRVADVLEAMQPDDAADLLSELPSERQEHLLHLMEPDDADDVRRLMEYGEYTAGGLMTTAPVILSPEATIAEGLAVVRRAELSPVIAAAAFVCRPPLETPTGRFLGVAHIQAMLRHAPHEHIGTIIDTGAESLSADAPISHVTRIMATYNLVSVPVTDPEGRLLGVVTVDDVLDHLLPDDWRDLDEIPSDPVTGELSLEALHAQQDQAGHPEGPAAGGSRG